MSGYTKWVHPFWADLPRLLGTSPEWAIVGWTLAMTIGAMEGGKRPEWAKTTIEDLAQFAHCDVRTAQRAVERLASALILQQKRSGKGELMLKSLHGTWQALPDYAPPKKPIASETELDDELVDDEPRPLNTETRRLTPKPIVARAGKPTRPVKIECGVKSFAWQNETPSDMLFDAIVKPGGDMVVTVRPADAKVVEIGRSKSEGPSDFNGLQSFPRQICRDGSQKTGVLAAGLEALGLRVAPSLEARLLSLLPSDCSPEAALLVVDERVNRRNSKSPLTVALLPKFFAEDVVEKWPMYAAEAARRQTAAEQQKSQPTAADWTWVDNAWRDMPGKQKGAYLSKGRTRLIQGGQWKLYEEAGYTAAQLAEEAETEARILLCEEYIARGRQ